MAKVCEQWENGHVFAQHEDLKVGTADFVLA